MLGSKDCLEVLLLTLSEVKIGIFDGKSILEKMYFHSVKRIKTMERKIIGKLKLWKDHPERKSLILLGCMTEVPASQMLVDDNVFKEFKGAFTEQFVLQQLVTQGFSPYYWSSNKTPAEIDFVVQTDQRVIPVEVRAEENVVKYVKNNFLRGRTFHNISQLNEEAVLWLSRTGNGLPHASTKLVPDEVFSAEKHHLTPYTGTPMMPERCMKEYTVHKSNIIDYHGNTYSVPMVHISDKVQKYGSMYQATLLKSTIPTPANSFPKAPSLKEEGIISLTHLIEKFIIYRKIN